MSLDWQAILETVPGGIVVLDAHRTIQAWNQAMESLTGYPKEAVLGQTDGLLRCTPANDGAKDSPSASAGSQEAPPAHPLECMLHRRDGALVPVLKRTSWLRDRAGQVLGTVCVFTDLRPFKPLPTQSAPQRSRTGNVPAARLIGKSGLMREVRERIRLAAESNATVLILGETGTGKELVAEAIHFQSERRDQPLVKVNCAALPETLLESELFGHVKGAFTGALKDKPGRFELADGGTLFLDEIGDLSPLIQLKLLRVVQDHEFERVGESRARRVDVRLIVATHRDLRRLVAEGRFREDLFYRLNVFPIHVPPLRERKTDLPLLIEHFLERFSHLTGKRITRVSPDVQRILMDFCWPGNVRQLENAIEHAFVTCQGGEIGLFDLPVEIRMTELRREICDQRGQSHTRTTPKCVDGPPARVRTKEELLALLAACGGSQAEAARRAGVDRTTVWRWLKRFEVPRRLGQKRQSGAKLQPK